MRKLRSAGSSTTTLPLIQSRPLCSPNSTPTLAISCMPTQMPRNGRACFSATSSSASTMPGNAVEPALAIRERADARQHDAVRLAHRVGIGGHDHARANRSGGFSQCLLGGAEISGPVIDDRNDHGSGPGRCGARGGGDALPLTPRTRCNPLPQDGGGLGRGKPVHDDRKPSLASPAPTLPRVGGGGVRFGVGIRITATLRARPWSTESRPTSGDRSRSPGAAPAPGP